MPQRQIMMVAGEASGDRAAAGLLDVLHRRRPGLRSFGMGGPALAHSGHDLIHGMHEISVMGIGDVLPKIPRILAVRRRLVRAALRRRPACAVLVDVPDFNLPLARILKSAGIPVVYYVSPMVWAWRQGRIRFIRRWVDRMLCILPFEEEFYRQRGVEARYVGSPLLARIPHQASREAHRIALGLDAARPTVALLPGSRPSEISRTLPALVDAAREVCVARPRLQVVVPVAPGLEVDTVMRPFHEAGLPAHAVKGRALEAVGASDVAVVTSGTATLEAALMERPLVVVYRASASTYAVGRALLKIQHVSLVNLLLQEGVVPELLQQEMNGRRIAEEVDRLWPGTPDSERVVARLGQLRTLLGDGDASEAAADEVLALVDRPPLLPASRA